MAIDHNHRRCKKIAAFGDSFDFRMGVVVERLTDVLDALNQ